MFSLAYKNVEKNKQKHGNTLHGRNNVDIWTSEITSKKVCGNNVNFLAIEITLIKVRKTTWIFWPSKLHQKKSGKNVDFSTIEITSKRISGNNVDFSTSEITSKKVRGNNEDFSISEITLKKFVEMTWKFVEIWSLTYRRNIDVELTWIRRGVPVGLDLYKHQYCNSIY